MEAGPRLSRLVELLNGLPATRVVEASDGDADDVTRGWFVRLELDVADHMAWHVVQELGCALNYSALNDSLPTVFMPVSPPPYMSGGPDRSLSWMIESLSADVEPTHIAELIEGRLPGAPSDLGGWTRCETGPCPIPEPQD